MNSPISSTDYFVNFLEKCIRHFTVIQDNYEVFQTEFEKIKEFVNKSDSQTLKQKFRFLLEVPEHSKTEDSKNLQEKRINQEVVRKQLVSIKCLTLIAIHLSRTN